MQQQNSGSDIEERRRKYEEWQADLLEWERQKALQIKILTSTHSDKRKRVQWFLILWALVAALLGYFLINVVDIVSVQIIVGILAVIFIFISLWEAFYGFVHKRLFGRDE